MGWAGKCTKLLPHSVGHDSDLPQHVTERETGKWGKAVCSQEEETDMGVGEQRTFCMLILSPQLP